MLLWAKKRWPDFWAKIGTSLADFSTSDRPNFGLNQGDIDVCYERSFGNVERLCRALAPHCLAIRSAFNDTLSLLQANTQSETFHTDMGRIDLLGEVAGLGDYLAATQFATLVELEDFAMYVLTLEGLIRAKEAAGREKDLLHLVTLRALKQMDDEGEA